MQPQFLSAPADRVSYCPTTNAKLSHSLGRGPQLSIAKSALVAVIAMATSLLVVVVPGSSTASAADPCAALPPGALGFGAQPLQSSDGCYDLGLPVGAKVRLSVSDYYSGVAITDSSGNEVCALEPSPGAHIDCTLSGASPFELRPAVTFSSRTYRATRLDDPSGCLDFSITTLDNLTATPFVGSDTAYVPTCGTVQLGVGPLLVLDSGEVDWTLYDIDANPVCRSVDSSCSVSEAGSHYLVAQSGSWGQFQLRAVPLAGSTCGTAAETSWAGAALGASLPEKYDIACLSLAGSPGQRMMLRLGFSNVVGEILDGAGKPGCDDLPASLGCTLTGVGPYRAIFRRTGPAPDTAVEAVAVRSVSPLVGCPAATISAFGSVAADNAPGVACRRITVPAGEYTIATDQDYTVYDEQTGAETCRTSDHCSFSADPQLLITEAVAPTFDLGLYQRASTSGCVAAGAGKSGRIAGGANNAMRCYSIVPTSGAVITRIDDLSMNWPSAEVVDAAGTRVCDFGANQALMQRCTLSGQSPYRVLVAPFAQRFDFTVLRTDTSSDCAASPQASFGSSTATTLSMSSGYVGCFSLDGDGLGLMRLAFVGSSAASRARLVAVDQENGACVTPIRSFISFDCNTSIVEGAHLTVVVQGDSTTPDTWQANWRSITSPLGCHTLSGALDEPAVAAELDGSLDADCFELATAPGDQVLGLRSADSSEVVGYADRPVYECQGGSPCQVKAGSRALFVVAPKAAVTAPQPYSFAAPKVMTATGPVDGCDQIAPMSFGFGPVTGTVGDSQPVHCYSVMDAPNTTLNAAVTAPAGSAPLVVGVKRGQSWSACYLSGVWQCSMLSDATGPELVPGLIVVGRVGRPLSDYSLTVTCSSWCRQDTLFVHFSDGMQRTAKVDEVLSPPDFEWNYMPTTQSYVWLRDGEPISGATSPTYRPTGDDLGHQLGLRIIASRPYFQDGVFDTAGPLIEKGVAPRNLTVPTIKGRVSIGRKVTAKPGAWSKSGTYHFAWLIKGRVVGTGKALKLKKAWLKKRLQLRVTVTRSGCDPSAPAYSARVRIRKR